MFYVYILKSETTRQYYIGQTNNLESSLVRHNRGQVKSTKNKGPWIIVHSELFASRPEAMTREKELKSKKSRLYIEDLIGH